MRILLLTPPMTQLNTPYPATPYLTGFLRGQGYDVVQADPALELVLRLFSRPGLERVSQRLSSKKKLGRVGKWFLENEERYLSTVEPVIRFLQGRDLTLAMRLVAEDFLPRGKRFEVLNDLPEDEFSEDRLSWAFGSLGTQDRAKYLASLYIDDLADLIREEVDSRFELSRYAEKLAASAPTFDPLEKALRAEPTLVDIILDEIAGDLFEKHRPSVLGLTTPFPGNVYGAFRLAAKFRALSPSLRVIWGGGYVNTELRSLSDPRVFDYMDYITLDDGERPLLNVLKHIAEGSGPLLRTYVREGDHVVLKNDAGQHDIPHKNTGVPTYEGLPLQSYLSILEMLNPMHRIWSDGRWNKLTLAHGCYWKKCSFCDVSLDYIGRYETAPSDVVVDRIEALIRETGQTGFHFVDEAAPPAVLRGIAERLIARGIVITWWGNIRFEKTFTPELVALLARSGCIAVSGGLEVASDRLLKLMNKGVTVDQVARVTRAFTEAGVMVHAYLMYGFPSQTEQETLDSLDLVRQLFAAGCIQSAYWHRFSATAHSPVGLNPEKYGIEILPEPVVSFARNDLDFRDPVGADHDMLGVGLRKSLYNFMHGLGLDTDVRFWFEKKLLPTTVADSRIEDALSVGPGLTVSLPRKSKNSQRASL